jgi:hypothetical protein
VCTFDLNPHELAILPNGTGAGSSRIHSGGHSGTLSLVGIESFIYGFY